MIRTLNEVVEKRAEVAKSIYKLEREMHVIRDEITDLKARGENALELYKKSNAIMNGLTRLRGIKEALDYMVNYDSNLDTEAFYIHEKARYQPK